MKNFRPFVVYSPILAVGLFLIIQTLFISMPGCNGHHTGDILACAFTSVWLWGLSGVIGSAVGIYLSKKMQKKPLVYIYTVALVICAVPLTLMTLLFTAGYIEKKGYDKQDAVWQKMFSPFKEATKGQAKYFRENKFYADSFQKLGIEFPDMSVVPCPAASAAQECLEGHSLRISLETQNDNRSYLMTFANTAKPHIEVEHFIVKSVSRHNSQDILMACDSMTQRGSKICESLGGKWATYQQQLQYGKMDYKIDM